MEHQHCLEKFPTLTALLIQVEIFLPTSYFAPGKTKQNKTKLEGNWDPRGQNFKWGGIFRKTSPGRGSEKSCTLKVMMAFRSNRTKDASRPWNQLIWNYNPALGAQEEALMHRSPMKPMEEPAVSDPTVNRLTAGWHWAPTAEPSLLLGTCCSPLSPGESPRTSDLCCFLDQSPSFRNAL